MKNAVLRNGSGMREAISNMYWKGCDYTMIEDVVEDATTADELMRGLNSLDLFYKFRLDRETETYVRLVGQDGMGNKHYFRAEKEV